MDYWQGVKGKFLLPVICWLQNQTDQLHAYDGINIIFECGSLENWYFMLIVGDKQCNVLEMAFAFGALEITLIVQQTGMVDAKFYFAMYA